jgi:hypothetical protein
MTDAHHLRDVVTAVRVVPPHSLSWLGREMPELAPQLRQAMSAEQAREQLLATLQFQLYHGFYCAGAIVARAAAGPREGDPEGFLDALSAANCGTGRWQPGWEVRDIRGSSLTATRDGLTVQAPLEDCRASAASPVPGGPVALRFPKESDRRSPGFYMAFGDVEFEPAAPGDVVRVYWHVRADGAPRLVRLLTSFLNDARLPFLLKVVDHPDRYLRCDAGVLYLRSGEWARAAATVARVHAAVRGALRDVTSPFTKRLARGLAVAEEPLTGESFGMHRCRLLADGLIGGAEQGIDRIEARLEIVRDRFAEEGVDLDAAHLNPGSSASYELALGAARRDRPPRAPAHENQAGVVRWQAAAQAIGARLCAQAFWHDGRCSWIGADPSAAPAFPGALPAPASSALGPTVYSGTAGVALFLAELARAGGDRDVRRTALGAARHALRHADRAPLEQRLGLYTGSLGVALAGARAGALLDDDECVAGARTLVRTCLRTRSAEREFDLLAGDAGAIVALLALAELLQDPGLLDEAATLGDELLAAADHEGDALCWQSRTWPDAPALTGLSHGAAGAGWALVELYGATGDVRWSEAAAAAFAYERRWFDGQVCNWRDLRPLPGNVPFMAAWCHGAPGIALSRLRAAELLDDPRLSDEAAAALQTTRETVQSSVRHGIDDFSLCHGLAGNADVLLLAARFGAAEEATATAAAVGDFGLDAYVDAGRPWACGTPGGEAPGLMMGLSGIGLFYLRLADPAVLTPLLPLPAWLAVTAPIARDVTVVPRPAESSASVVAVDSRLDDERLAAIVRAAMRTHGFALESSELDAAASARWHVGLALRDRMLRARLPEFADAVDYLSLPDVDPHLWNSLPFMLAFGHEQALVLAAVADVDPSARGELAEVCAVFSALLSVFDYVVDERPYSEAVFDVEGAAVAGLFSPAGADETLAATYARTPDLPVRLVCVLFSVLARSLRAHVQTADPGASAAVEEVTKRLFAAERRSTLGQATTLPELRALAQASREKSVLPFIAMMRIVGLVAPDPEPEGALQRAAALGMAICLADDLVDVLDDLRRGAPSPVVLAIAERLAARGLSVATDEDIVEVVRGVAGELVDLLASSALGEGAEGAVAAFARLSVARWVGWSEDDAAWRRRPPVPATAAPAAC